MEVNEQEWNELLLRLSKQFKVTVNHEFILFVIGVNERGSGFRNYSKDEKMDLMNLGSCVLMHHMGRARLVGADQQGWPVYESVDAMNVDVPSSEDFYKQAMIDFFRNR